MLNKIFIIILFIILASGLTFGVFAFFNKDIYLPYIEKRPDEVLKLMVDKMYEIQTYEYDGEFEVDIHFDTEKLNLDFSRANEIVAVLNDQQPVVLGINNINDENKTGEAELLYENTTIPFFSEKLTDIKYQYSVSGKFDKSNESSELKMGMNFDLGNIIFKAGIETKSINDSIYLKLVELPVLSHTR